jgi:hypothetical protein
MTQWLNAALVAVAALTIGQPSWAWEHTGHEWISGIAIEKLPESVPAFVRTPQSMAAVARMGNEPDLWKGAGRTHDAERDPAHFINLADDGAIMGVLPYSELPPTREQYDTLLRARGFTQYRAGYLPYSIVDGWQQVAKDFAYWRAALKGVETATAAEDRAFFESERKLREMLTLRDIGVWSHFPGDASQPLHVSVHFDGWGNYPNPNGYTTGKIHSYFEGEFVKENLSRAMVAAEVGPYAPCGCSIEERTKTLILRSLAQVVPLYALQKEGGFVHGDRRGIAFATDRLAAGAIATRNMIVDAWLDSASGTVGFAAVKVSDIESGKVKPTREMFGSD